MNIGKLGGNAERELKKKNGDKKLFIYTRKW